MIQTVASQLCYVCEVLTPEIVSFIHGKPCMMLQHDNIRPHAARITRDALQNANVDYLQNVPALSPDLNPIEH